MRSFLLATASGLFLAGLSSPLGASGTADPEVIYGTDTRIDYYQELDPAIVFQADSTVALLHATNLAPVNGDPPTARILSQPFGPTLNLCPQEPFYDQPTAAFCSGFLVAPDTVVTAGHCIDTQASCDGTRFVFGYKVEWPMSYPQTVPWDQVFSCKQIVHTVSNPVGEDFAVVKLDRRVTEVPPLTLRHSGAIQVGDPVRVIGYPEGIPVKIAGGAFVRSVQAEFFVANTDTFGGNSGSPIFNSVTGQVEGVLVRGDMDFVLSHDGCMIDHRCPADGCRGEDATLIERVIPYLEP